ncbi:flavoprotein [Streptomyces sp. NPDC050085]|uniref:flavoprotein n=1 Tax=Streptomyces sp. NPDC050085 TaxID=3365600 RepID=UPI00378F5D27
MTTSADTPTAAATDLPAAPPGLPLPRKQLLLVGTGAFDVIHLPYWALTLRVKFGWDVRVCLTASADALVSRRAIAAASRNPVSGPDWDTERGLVPHQELAQWADLVVVLPATTSFIGKCAAGIPDSLALTVVLNSPAPVVIGPSIPEVALSRPAVRRNLRTLEEDGFHVVPRRSGISVHAGAAADGWSCSLGAALTTAAKALASPGH